MGQKINPRGFRLGIINDWDSRWFAQKGKYRDLVLEDKKIRQVLMSRLKTAGVAQIEIERLLNKVEIIIHVSRPGVVIGRGGSGMEELKNYLKKIINVAEDKKGGQKLDLKVEPVKEPNLNAQLVASNIAEQLVRRIPHKRAVKQSIEKVMAAGASGVRIMLSGRIAGATISRREKYQEGRVPLTTLREKIDFAAVPSLTKSGYVGVKVWICKP
ncbi:30S ribosomal protein S3 [Candidatus Microgenomates bacterium]|nr:30S ribosomal protein S3 [Candidatus Microgenomates bacterium]